MPIPTFDTFMRPILVRATNEPITRRSMADAMVEEFNLADEERAELLPSGSATYINNRVGWAMTFLTKAKLIKKVEKFTYRATETAEDFLKKHPNGISDKDLKSIEGYEAAWDRKATKGPKPESTTSSTATPEARICENTRRWAAAHPHSGPVVKDAAELRAWLAQQEEPELVVVREDTPPYGNQKR